MKKRIIAVALCVILLALTAPTAFAAEVLSPYHPMSKVNPDSIDRAIFRIQDFYTEIDRESALKVYDALCDAEWMLWPAVELEHHTSADGYSGEIRTYEMYLLPMEIREDSGGGLLTSYYSVTLELMDRAGNGTTIIFDGANLYCDGLFATLPRNFGGETVWELTQLGVYNASDSSLPNELFTFFSHKLERVSFEWDDLFWPSSVYSERGGRQMESIIIGVSDKGFREVTGAQDLQQLTRMVQELELTSTYGLRGYELQWDIWSPKGNIVATIIPPGVERYDFEGEYFYFPPVFVITEYEGEYYWGHFEWLDYKIDKDQAQELLRLIKNLDYPLQTDRLSPPYWGRSQQGY